MANDMVFVGIDEVGRGCWAGPLVVGAVILGNSIDGLKDSKKLSKSRRCELDRIIHREALAVGLGWVTAKEIDGLGLSRSLKLAMERAIKQISVKYDQIIIDGNINYLADNYPSKAVIRADQTIPVVSAASIVAKVARDNFMALAAQTYSVYAFEKNVGYGTSEHLVALKEYGICDLHRRSFRPISQITTAKK